VAASVDSDNVHLLLWNKLTLRMPRKQVVWSRQNWRWESDGTGTFHQRMSCRVLSGARPGSG